MILQSAATWPWRVPPTDREGKVISRRQALSGEKASLDPWGENIPPSPIPKILFAWIDRVLQN